MVIKNISHIVSRVIELVLKSDETALKALEITLNSKAAEAFGEAVGNSIVESAFDKGSFSVGDL